MCHPVLLQGISFCRDQVKPCYLIDGVIFPVSKIVYCPMASSGLITREELIQIELMINFHRRKANAGWKEYAAFESFFSFHAAFLSCVTKCKIIPTSPQITGCA